MPVSNQDLEANLETADYRIQLDRAMTFRTKIEYLCWKSKTINYSNKYKYKGISFKASLKNKESYTSKTFSNMRKKQPNFNSKLKK